MCGGKSSSSSSNASTQTTTTTTGSATGTVGDVYQGQTVNITDQFPTEAVEVFKQLTNLVGNSIDIAAAAGQKALEANAQLTTVIKQPDVALAGSANDAVKYIALAAGAAVVAYIAIKR